MARLFKQWKDIKLHLGSLIFFFGCSLLFICYIGNSSSKHRHQAGHEKKYDLPTTETTITNLTPRTIEDGSNGRKMGKEEPMPQTINNRSPQITEDDHNLEIPGKLWLKAKKPPTPDKNAGIHINGSVNINVTIVHSPGNMMMESTSPSPTLDVYFVNRRMDVKARQGRMRKRRAISKAKASIPDSEKL